MTDPRQKDFDERHTRLPVVTALTKREYFAVMAMQGLLAHEGTHSPYDISKEAIAQADELLKQLSQ